jgi:hypothetical protein
MSNAPASFLANPTRPALAGRARLAGLLAAVALVAACGGGGGGGDGGAGEPPPPPPPGPAALPCVAAAPVADSVTIFGTARYRQAPRNANGIGLNYNAGPLKEIRGATAELLDAGGNTLSSCVTDPGGAYAFNVPFAALTGAVRVRVRAEMRKTSAGGGQWDFSVRDNTRGDALYVLDSPLFTPAQDDQILQERSLQAESGFSAGVGYTGARAAGPFSILDVVFEATQKVLSVSPDQGFPPLKLFWSPDNITVDGDLSLGEIGTSFYQFSAGTGHELFLLGQEDVDTDEYDRHVIAHEWGHYFQSAFSRDDSPGGPHSGGDRLDMRVAFSEGFGNGWAGIVLDDPVYADSQDDLQAGGFTFNVSQTPAADDRGWFSESSVQFLMWSFHDENSIGFGPMFSVLTGPLRTSDSFTAIHNFSTLLKAAAPTGAGAVDALLQGQGITAQDALGTNETNDGGVALALPLYRPAGGQHCVSAAAGRPNKLGNRVYIRFNASGTRQLRLSSVAGQSGSDPDFFVTRSDGTRLDFESSAADSEQATNVDLPAGTHTMEIFDFNLLRGAVAGTRCFNLTIQ